MKKIVIRIFKLFKELKNIEWLLILSALSVGLVLILISFLGIINLIFAKKPAYGGILKEGVYQKINTLNPFLAENPTEKSLIYLIYDSLVRPNGQGSYEYELTKNIIEINKGLGYEVELKDAYWSNGTKISSDDIITTLSIIKTYSSGELYEYFKDVKVEKIDNYKVRFILPIKDNLFIQKLSFLKIVPAKEWLKYPPSQWQANEENLIKVTSGPFVFSKKYSLKNGVNVYEFVRNDYYFKKPFLDKILIYEYPDLKSAYEALKAKEIDAIGGISSSYLDSISKRSYKTNYIVLPRIIAVFFNIKRIKFEVAQNLNSILNRDAIIKEVFGNSGEPSNSIFSPSLKKFLGLPEIKKQTTNPGTYNYSDITIIVPDNFFLIKIANYLQNKFNFQIKIETPFNIINQIIPEKNYDALLYGISYRLMPDIWPIFSLDSPLHLTNTDSKEIIKKIQDLYTGDIKNFKSNLEEIDRLINEIEPIVFIGNNFYVYVLPANLKGFDLKYLNEPYERFVKVEDWYCFEKIAF